MKLNNKGSTHLLLLFGVLVLSAVVGVYTIVSSYADTNNPTTNSSQLPYLSDDLKTYNNPKTDQDLADRQSQLPDDLKLQSDNSEDTAKLNQKPRKTSLVIKRSQKIAKDFWHDVAPRGYHLCSKSDRGNDVQIRYAKMGSKTIAYTYANGDSKNNRPDCTIWVNKYLKGRIPGGYADNLCETIIHEYGHLYGFGHSHHPGYIMNPNATGDKIKRCNQV